MAGEGRAVETAPEEFRFEIQGPNALEVMDEVTDHPLPDISFFGMDTITIDGVEIYVLAHGMSSVPGWEIFGPYEHHDEVKSTILDAGAEYGIRHVGRKSYLSGTVPTGWFPVLIPAIYERSGSASVKEGNRIPLNEGFTDVEPRVEWMAEHGIDRTLVSVSTPNPLAGAFTPEQSTELVTAINDGYAAARNEHPDVFAGLGMLPLREPEAAVREVDRVANELQLSSIALPTSIPEGKLSSEDLRPTFEAVDDHDLTVFFHPHGNALSDSLGPEESFLSSLIVFEFDVVLPHMGGTLLHLGGRIDRGRQEFDEEDTDTIVADFRAVVTDDDDRRRVASETARTLFDL
jgi:predicted TIM-barrel fold metal-dependent hydrolase